VSGRVTLQQLMGGERFALCVRGGRGRDARRYACRLAGIQLSCLGCACMLTTTTAAAAIRAQLDELGVEEPEHVVDLLDEVAAAPPPLHLCPSCSDPTPRCPAEVPR
jgi:predicted RecB family endonuclease